MKLEKLVKMANQIAANLSYGDEGKAAEGVCDHLRRFWTPDMRAQIIEHYRQGGADLSPVAKAGVAKLAEKETRAA
ncbi:MAG TPA: formate dehydrogenase subunit delta [Gammaproteobacteria bacterium]